MRGIKINNQKNSPVVHKQLCFFSDFLIYTLITLAAVLGSLSYQTQTQLGPVEREQFTRRFLRPR